MIGGTVVIGRRPGQRRARCCSARQTGAKGEYKAKGESESPRESIEARQV